MPLTTALFALTIFASLFAAPAFGSLYPNRPVANTIYHAGRRETVTWVEDGHAPPLAEVPKLQLDLHNPDDSLAEVITKDLDPQAKKFEVWLSPTLGMNSSGYFFRFHGDKIDIYTARFTITGVTGGETSNTSAVTTPATPSASAAAAPAAQNAAAASLVPAATALAAAAAGGGAPNTPTTASAVPSAVNLIPTLPPISTAPGVTAPPATLVPHTVITAVQNSAASLFDFDAELLKFRIVFILWPAVMGISLAL